jgi:glycosyltransferase involved in cell wall biosynthesis
VFNKLKILFISPYLPAVDTTACSRKIFDNISLLQERDHLVYLFSFCSQQDKKRIEAVRPYCKQLNLEFIKDYSRYPINPFYIRKKIELLYKNFGIDILQCEKAYLGQYLPRNISIPSILVEHEILSVSFSEKKNLENNIIKKLILFSRSRKKCLEERKWYRKFDQIIVFSKNDQDLIQNLYKIKNIEVIPLGINLKDYPPECREKKIYDLIFVGNFSHYPNVDAVIYFYQQILPLIRNKLPNVTILLVGANPPHRIKKLTKFDKNLLITGYVENIKEYFQKSKVLIAPIRYGTGMRLKILEAMAQEVPVVTTSIGIRGITPLDNMKIANTPKEFVKGIIELLKDQNQYRDLAKKGRLIVEKYFNWQVLLNKYEDIYYKLLAEYPERKI